jgi:hypothetical protein
MYHKSINFIDLCHDSVRIENGLIWLFHDPGIYSPNAYRGFAREFIKDLERMR